MKFPTVYGIFKHVIHCLFVEVFIWRERGTHSVFRVLRNFQLTKTIKTEDSFLIKSFMPVVP